MQNDHLERRVFTRIPIPGKVIVTDGSVLRTGSLLDLSLAGLLAEMTDAWQPQLGQRYEIEVLLAAELSICMRAHPAHIEMDAVGFTIETLDLESISRLRRMVELNLGDSTLLNRELAALTRH